jgi:hypothetical protein
LLQMHWIIHCCCFYIVTNDKGIFAYKSLLQHLYSALPLSKKVSCRNQSSLHWTNRILPTKSSPFHHFLWTANMMWQMFLQLWNSQLQL